MSNPSRPDVGSPTRYVVLGLALAAVVVLVARYGGYGGQAPESALPALNAGLNAVSTILLVIGLRAIRAGQRDRHAQAMLHASLVSAAFLGSYLYYHFGVQAEVGPTPFRRTGLAKTAYLALLASHVLLAMVNLPMVLRTLWLARVGSWDKHRRLARWTWPIWFYVSITGVLVYLALYHWNLPPDAAAELLPEGGSPR